MAFITSRQRPAARPVAAHLGLLLATTLPAAASAQVPASALPPAAAASTANAPTPTGATPAPQTLPAMKARATADNDFKAETSANAKYTQPLVDTPQSITVIRKELAAQQGATTLTEALRNTPGVSTFYVGENGSTSTGDAIYLRGFDASGSLFVDGIRDLGAVSRDLFNVEQIEVTKGPAGTDTGRTSPTGGINLVTKQAHRDAFVAGSVTLGTERQQRGTADLNRPLGEHAALRLNLMWQDSDRPGRDQVKDRRWGVAPSLALGLGTSSRFTVDVVHVEQDNVPDGGVFTIGLPGYTSPDPARPQIGDAPRVDPSNFYGASSDFDEVESDQLTLRSEHDVAPGVVVRNTTRFGRHRQDALITSFLGQATGTYPIVTPDLDDPSTWLVTRNRNTRRQSNEIVANQTGVVATFTTGGLQHDVSAGLELSQERVRNRTMLGTGTSPTVSVYDPQPDTVTLSETGARATATTRTAGLYAFDTLTITPQWLLTAGLRVDRYSTDYDAVTVATDGVATPVLLGDRDTLLNWKLGGVWKPAGNGSVYVDVATSQNPPGGSTLLFSTSASNAANPVFEPQRTRTWEVGTKWELLKKQLALTAALFRTDVSNEVEADPVDPTVFVQTGRKRVQGLELTASGMLNADWGLNLGYSWLDTKVVSGAAAGNDPNGTGLNYTPRHAFTAWTSYRLPMGFTVGGGARYNGRLQRGRDGAVGTPAYTDAYWVCDGMVGWQANRHLDLRLNVHNATDADYVAAINKSGYRYAPGAPRYVTLTANVLF